MVEKQQSTLQQDMLDMLCRPITSELLSHVADQAALVIPCCLHSNNNNNKPVLPSLPSFIGFLVKRSSVRTGTLLGSLVFLQRLQQTLSTIAKGMSCTSHRIFLATLIVTSKALHDTSPKNKHWAKYAAYFTLSEINLMEKQLLLIMNYHVLISPADLANAFYRFKQATSLPPSPISYLVTAPLPTYKKLSPLMISGSSNDVDMPTYAAAQQTISSLPSLMNDSQNSLSSEDDYLDETISPLLLQQPEPAHCRQQGELKEQELILLNAHQHTTTFLTGPKRRE